MMNLKKERDLQSMILNTDLSACLNQERRLHIKNLTTDYLSNKIKESELIKVSDVKVMMNSLRDMYNELKNDTCEPIKISTEMSSSRSFSKTTLEKSSSNTVKVKYC